MGEGYAGQRKKEGGDGFETIDDLLAIAEYLYKGLINLSNQRHPLSVYKGVKHMQPNNQHEMVKASTRTYFFDIERTKNGKPYLKLTESRINPDTKEQQRNTLLVFEEDLEKFTGTLNVMAKRMQ